MRGDVQKTKSDVDLDTYSPVVQWSTVRLMLFMSGKMNLVTQSIDFSNAFAQAELEKPVYMEPPKGYDLVDGDKVLKLKRSLYGQIECAKLW